VIYPCRWLAKNRHGKSMSHLQFRVELNPKTILIATAGDRKNLCKIFTRRRRLDHCETRDDVT
jgi:hypothetical protein